MLLISQIVARPGAAEVLQALAADQDTSLTRPVLEDLFRRHGTPEPVQLIDEFLGAHLLARLGSRLGLSVFGVRTALLLDALNGGDVEDVFRRLRRLTGVSAAYELVQEGMTGLFFQSLLEKPGFGRLYICSPWIHPSPREAACLHYATMKMQERTKEIPELLVISRPPDSAPKGTEGGFDAFLKLGARVFFHRRLHSKLYIREPDLSGGYLMAIVGSQNLTRSEHLELGIRINGDERLIGQLIQYFFDLMSQSKERT